MNLARLVPVAQRRIFSASEWAAKVKKLNVLAVHSPQSVRRKASRAPVFVAIDVALFDGDSGWILVVFDCRFVFRVRKLPAAIRNVFGAGSRLTYRSCTIFMWHLAGNVVLGVDQWLCHYFEANSANNRTL